MANVIEVTQNGKICSGTEDADSIKCLGVTVKKFRDCFDVNFKNYFNVKIDDKMIMSGENVFRLMYAIYLDIDKKAKTSKKDFFKKNCNALFQKILRGHFLLFIQSITIPLLSFAISASRLWNLSQRNFFQKLWDDLSFSESNDMVKKRNTILDCVMPYLKRWILAFA